jgi:hypothetical protein
MRPIVPNYITIALKVDEIEDDLGRRSRIRISNDGTPNDAVDKKRNSAVKVYVGRLSRNGFSPS